MIKTITINNDIAMGLLQCQCTRPVFDNTGIEITDINDISKNETYICFVEDLEDYNNNLL